MYKKRSEIFDSSFVYFLIIALFVIVRILASTFTINTIMGYVLNVIIQVGLMFCLPIFAYSFLRRQKIKNTFKQYNFKKIGIKSIFISIVIGIFVYLTTIFIATFFSSFISLLGYESSKTSTVTSYPLWLLFVELGLTAVLPGICEEVAHRGMLLSTYKKFGSKKAIILTGLMFGLMHMNIEQFFYTSIIGMFLGFLVLATDSIYPAMIIHFMNNAISTFMGYSSANNLPISAYLNNFVSSILGQNAVTGIFMLFITVLFFVMVIFALTTILIKDTKIKQIKSTADEIMKKQLRDEIMVGLGQNEQNKQDNSNVEVISNVVGQKKIYSIIVKNTNPIVPYKSNFKEKIFIYASLFVGIISTICTFIWGII